MRPKTTPFLLLVPIVALGLLIGVGTAAAQYAGHERGFLVTPLRVPSGGDLSGVGFGCVGGSTVTITIQGEPGILTTVLAGDDGTYSFTDAPIPGTLVVGDTYTAVASCGGAFETALFTVICANGDEPDVDGNCPISPTTTATTSVPGSSSTITDDSGGIDDPLAFTGASTFGILRVAGTLIGLGALLVLIGRRREQQGGPARAC